MSVYIHFPFGSKDVEIQIAAMGRKTLCIDGFPADSLLRNLNLEGCCRERGLLNNFMFADLDLLLGIYSFSTQPDGYPLREATAQLLSWNR